MITQYVIKEANHGYLHPQAGRIPRGDGNGPGGRRPDEWLGQRIRDRGLARRLAGRAELATRLSLWAVCRADLGDRLHRAARGEPAMADFIATLDMSVFVLDYDHNATTVEWLAKTHEPFFKRIRAAHADLPVLMLTRPDSDRLAEQPAERRAVIRATCENARAAGDRHVAFVDGATFYGASDRDACSNDGCHPNDLGMHRIAQALCPVLAKLLES